MTPPDASPAAPGLPASDGAPLPRWRRWLGHPLARIGLFLAVGMSLAWLLGRLFAALGWSSPAAAAWVFNLSALVGRIVPALTAYLLLAWWIERRRVDELAWRRWLPEGGLGLAIGCLLISVAVAVLWAAGGYRVTGLNPDAPWVRPLLVMGIGTAVLEEILFRGVVFRIIEDSLGTWAALGISALFFGAVHLGNPNATVWSSVAIAIEAGLLLGMLYHASRSLPLVIGVHAAWNFAQGTVYGIPVSGTAASGWLVATREGPDWLSGGAFGIEASVIAVGLSTLVVAALVRHALRRGTIVRRRR